MNLCMLALVLMTLYLCKATKSNSKGRVKNTATSSGKIESTVSPKFEPAKNHLVRKLKTTNRQTKAEQRHMQKSGKNQSRHKLKTIAGNWEYYYNAKQDTCMKRKLSPNAIAKFKTLQQCLSHSRKSKKFRCWEITKQGMCKAVNTLRACKLHKDKKIFETEKSCIAASNAVHICWYIMKNVCTSVKLKQQCTSFKHKTYYSTEENCKKAAGKIKKCWLSEGEGKCKPLMIKVSACDSYTKKKLYVSLDSCIAASTRYKCFYLNATTQTCHGKKMVKPCESLDIVYFRDRQLCETASKRVQKCFKLSTDVTKCVLIKVIVPCIKKYGLFDTIEACREHYKVKRCFWKSEKNSKCTMSWRRLVCRKEGPITYFDTMTMCRNAQVSSTKCYKFDKEKSDCLPLSIKSGINCSSTIGYFSDYSSCKTAHTLRKKCYKFDQENSNCLQMSMGNDFDCSATIDYYDDYSTCNEANGKFTDPGRYGLSNGLCIKVKEGSTTSFATFDECEQQRLGTFVEYIVMRKRVCYAVRKSDVETVPRHLLFHNMGACKQLLKYELSKKKGLVPYIGSRIVTKAPKLPYVDKKNFTAIKYYVDPDTDKCMPTATFKHPPIYPDLVACMKRDDKYNMMWCPMHEFGCLSDHKCISENLLCNNIKECSDGSDESSCEIRYLNFFGPRSYCGKDYFVCRDEDLCLPKVLECNGFADCVTGSDEENCAMS